jgi:GDP-L-fucose synthase
MIPKDSKIMVTGARGLVGLAFVELLKNKGYENIVSVGREDCNLVNQVETLAFIQDHKPEYIFHSAARVYGIMGNMCHKALSFYDNAMININVVHGAYLAGVKKITVMGTGCVYPYPSPSLPLKEEMVFSGRPHESENSYAQAKRAMLAMCEAYKESHQLDWAYVISCNLFGPNDKFDTEFGHVVPSLVKKFFDAKKSGGKVSVWGDGSAQRDFLYVKDAAQACLAIMEKTSGACNMGSGQVYSIRYIVETLAEIANLKNSVEWDSTKPNGQDYRSYDLSRLNQTGFKAQWSIEEGLRETWDWYCQSHTTSKNKEAMEQL